MIKWRTSQGGASCAVVALLAAGVSAAPNLSAAADELVLNQDVSVRNIRRHQQALQKIANRNDDNRAAGTAGYDQSTDYVERRLKRAGYEVTRHAFEFTSFSQLSPAVFEQTAPDAATFEEGVDFNVFDQSDSGDVTAAVSPVDLSIDDPAAATSGCEAEDFAGFPAGNIALIQRGVCDFEVKVENAAAAGAVGAIIFNQGNGGPDRTDLFGGTLGADNTSGIPAFAVSFPQGVAFAGVAGLEVHMTAETLREVRTSENVLAELPGAAPADAQVVVVGAHLDSVAEGPGINDNGSGTATILELALLAAEHDVHTANRVRWAFWGAEEAGLIGSTEYVLSRTEEELAEIALNLNFDMVGSPNFARFIYDGDGSDTEIVGPAGSDVIEQLFVDHFATLDLATEPTAFDGRSDYGPFIAVDIPAGGLFTGAEGIKTEEQAALYGGTAGEAFDPCYHAACDDIDNNSNQVLGEMAFAAGSVLLQVANAELPLVARTVTTASRQAVATSLDSFEWLGGHLQR